MKNAYNGETIKELIEESLLPGGDTEAPVGGMFPHVRDGEEAPDSDGYGDARPMSEDDLREIVIGLNEDEKERKERWVQRWKRNRELRSYDNAFYRLYQLSVDGLGHLYQVSGEVGGSCSLEPVSAAEHLDNVGIACNHLRKVVESIASRMNFRSSVLRGYPRTPSTDDISAAAIVTKFAQHFAESPEVQDAAGLTSILLPTFGTSISKVEWDRFARSTRKTKNGQTIEGDFGWVRTSVIAPYKFMYPAGAKEIEHCSWACDAELWSWAKIARCYPEKAELIDPRREDENDYLWADSVIDFNDESLGNPQNVTGSTASLGSLLRVGAGGEAGDDGGCPLSVVSCYERMAHPEWGEYIHKTVYCQGVELESRPLIPMFRDDDGTLMVRLQPDGSPKLFPMPYNLCRYYRRPDKMMGAGVIGDIYEINRIIAALNGLLMKNGFDVTNTFMMYQAGNALTPIYSRAFTVLKYASNTPEFHKIKGQFNELILLLRHYEQKIYDVVMMPEVAMGQSPGADTSGRAIDYLTNNAGGAFGNIRSRVADHVASWATRAIEILQWHLDEEAVLYGVGQGDGTGTLVFRGADLVGATDIQASLEVELPDDMPSRVEMAMGLMQSGVLETADDFYDFVKPGGSWNEATGHRDQSDALAMHYISLIIQMDERDAEERVEQLMNARQIVEYEAGQNQAPPEESADAIRDELMEDWGLGVEPFHDAKRQLRKTQNWLNQLETLSISGAKKALVNERVKMLVGKALPMPEAGIPESMPPEQEEVAGAA